MNEDRFPDERRQEMILRREAIKFSEINLSEDIQLNFMKNELKSMMFPITNDVKINHVKEVITDLILYLD
jgi:hypothetical protein